MTYQGERARALPRESDRFFEVTQVRLGADGHVSDVLWSEVDAGSDRAVGAGVLASAAEVVEAIHEGAQVAAVFASSASRLPERQFVVVKHADGRECLTFADGASPGRDLSDIAVLASPLE